MSNKGGAGGPVGLNVVGPVGLNEVGLTVELLNIHTHSELLN